MLRAVLGQFVRPAWSCAASTHIPKMSEVGASNPGEALSKK